MMLSDKLGELNSTFGWRIEKTTDNKFVVVLWTMPQIGPKIPHEMKTSAHDNIHKAVDEANEIFKKHLADCAIC